MIYLDANATEPQHPAALAAALAALDITGNPSSIHGPGRAARRLLEDARESIAARLSGRPQDVIFTSGATEANALAIHTLGQGRPILIGATEHDAIRASAPNATVIQVTPSGLIDPDHLETVLAQHPSALVCLMAANNETGVIHDIATAAVVCARHGAVLHVDAAQAAARAPENWLGMGAASIAVSGHKAGGPMGAGALIFAGSHNPAPLLRGGGQERGWRGGTPALPAIAGMAAALSEPYNTPAITACRDALEAACRNAGAIIAGVQAPRLPNTTCLILPGLKADTQLIALDLAGFAVSAGAACSSGKLAASHVLTAMGFSDLANNAIRVSLPWNVEPAAIPAFTTAYTAMTNRALHSARAQVTEHATAI